MTVKKQHAVNGSRSAGFSPVMVIGCILVVIILVVTALNAFSGGGSGDDTNKDTGSSKDDSDSKDSSKSSTKKDDGKYLMIPEWSVQFTVPTNMRGDISYALNLDGLDVGRTPRIQLFSKKFSDSTFQCDATNTRVLISMYRYSENLGGLQQFPPPFTALSDGTRYYMDATACQSAIRRGGSDADKKLLKSLEDAVKQTLEEM